jgi:hypothetical protein
MTVRLYLSTDASAPTLTGQVGSLTTLLDAVLVNGYGSQTAAGWSTTQTTTNKRQYQQATGGNSGATGCSVWVDDTGPGAAGAREARLTGFETMTGLGTGTGQFPTNAQLNIGTTPNSAIILRKSTTADSTARPWIIIANGHTFYMFTETGDFTNPTRCYSFVFGDFFSYHASDTYAVVIGGRTAENSGSSNVQCFLGIMGLALGGATNGIYVDRSFTTLGGSVPVNMIFDFSQMGNNEGLYGGGNTNVGSHIGYNASPPFMPYPNPADGGLHVSPLWLFHNNGKRGYFGGLWCPKHHLPMNHKDTFTVSGGNLNGKSFIAVNILIFGSNTDNTGLILVETSDTWT